MIINWSKDKQWLIEAMALISFFIFLAYFSYSHVDQSASLIKYHFQWGISNLLQNYELYHHSFKDFLFQTSAYHQGNTESEWRTVFYLLPLFLYSDFLGGLSLNTICLFTVTCLLMALFLFYWWMREFWGKETAAFAAIFFGFSAMFQEIARSGSYLAYSVLIVMIWLLIFSHVIKSSKLRDYCILGLFTGLTWYGYGMLRCLTLIAIVQIVFLNNNVRRDLALGMLLLGVGLVVLPGFLILSMVHGHFAGYHGPWNQVAFDREYIHIHNDYFKNLEFFVQRLLGANQRLEPVLKDQYHAHLFSTWLLVPFLIGLGVSLRKLIQEKAWLFLVICIIIYAVPMFTSSVGYSEARRSLLYVIPSYALIGIGIKEFFDWQAKFNNKALKVFVGLLFIACLVRIVNLEKEIILRRIIFNNRDLGLIELAQKVKQVGGGNILYLEKGNLKYRKWGLDNILLTRNSDSIYWFTYESELMSFLLMDHGTSVWKVKSMDPSQRLTSTGDRFYIVQSPLVSPKEFSEWVKRNRLECRFEFKTQVTNLNRTEKNIGTFNFYRATKLPDILQERR